MNTTERDQLVLFLQQLTRAQAGPKDVEAQSLIARALAQQPDAAYLLVQRALLQDGALQVAQQKIAQLQDELDKARPPAGGGFLDQNAWGRAPAQPMAATPSAGVGVGLGYAPAPSAAPLQAVPAAAAPSAGFQAPSFLTSMATTAAGVAAGAFLFQGIGHLMGNGHQGAAASAFGLSDPQANNALDAGVSRQPTEVVNNYFDTPAPAPDRFLEASSGADGVDGFDTPTLDLDGSDDWA